MFSLGKIVCGLGVRFGAMDVDTSISSSWQASSSASGEAIVRFTTVRKARAALANSTRVVDMKREAVLLGVVANSQ